MSETPKKAGTGILVNLVVAAVSVAVTLTVTSLMAPETTDTPGNTTGSSISTTEGDPSGETTLPGGVEIPEDTTSPGGAEIPQDTTAPTQTEPPAQDERIQKLENENAALREKLNEKDQEITQLKDTIAQLSASINNPDEDTDVSDILGDEYVDNQTKAYDLFGKIQAAYEDYDRDTLEKLCPQLNELLEYLSEDARKTYYMILEYMEQPSND